ncbi:ABC transporter ATP-binding protein [Carnobacteriaceae bacterium zg-C25]|nr:ABC transporter ATP-binding protein [Carnobacteriaceae bacterium zg-C25]
MLQVKELTGGYTRIPAISNISFSMLPGQFYAVVGLNGAGKSTLLHHLTATMSAFSGEVELDGVTPTTPQAYKQKIAYVPETPILYDELTLKEHVELVARVYQVPFDETLEKAMHYARLFRLDNRLEWFPSAFSKGMKQKVMLILALMLDVPLYIIDEPFMGLDPIAIKDLLNIFQDKLNDNAMIIVSTHILSQIHRDIDKVLFMHKGQLIEEKTVSTLLEDYQCTTVDDLFIAMVSKQQGAENG